MHHSNPKQVVSKIKPNLSLKKVLGNSCSIESIWGVFHVFEVSGIFRIKFVIFAAIFRVKFKIFVSVQKIDKQQFPRRFCRILSFTTRFARRNVARDKLCILHCIKELLKEKKPEQLR